MAQTLCIFLLGMIEAVWGEYQPQPWCCCITSTPQVNPNPQIWGPFFWCNCIKVRPKVLDTANQCPKHFVYVYNGCMKLSEINISLRDFVASFPLLNLSEPQSPNLGPTWLVLLFTGATICCSDSIPMAKILFICLIWMEDVVWSECQPQSWCCVIIYNCQVNLNPQIWSQFGWCNGIRVQPYALQTAY